MFAFVSVGVLATGCATHRQSRSTARFGGYAALVGVGVVVGSLAVASAQRDENDGLAVFWYGGGTGVVMVAGGLLLGVGGMIGTSLHDEEDDPSTAKPGFLTIYAEEVMAVVIDGKHSGTTPLERRRIDPGPHRIEMRDLLTNAVRMHHEVEISSGEHERIRP